MAMSSSTAYPRSIDMENWVPLARGSDALLVCGGDGRCPRAATARAGLEVGGQRRQLQHGGAHAGGAITMLPALSPT